MSKSALVNIVSRSDWQASPKGLKLWCTEAEALAVENAHMTARALGVNASALPHGFDPETVLRGYTFAGQGYVFYPSASCLAGKAARKHMTQVVFPAARAEAQARKQARAQAKPAPKAELSDAAIARALGMTAKQVKLLRTAANAR